MPTNAILIETKFSPPLQAHQLPGLARLDAVLAVCLEERFVCLSAPAGFGKTTSLLRQRRMLEAQGCRVAWLSLDRDDNAPERFLRYVIGAVQRAGARPGQHGRATHESNIDSLKATLAALCAEAPRDGGTLALMLDDYHLIEQDAVHALLRWLAGQPALRVLVSTRHCLPQQFGATAVVRIGTDALSLTATEAACFLRERGAQELSPSQMQALFQKTEGWPAGLQLVAMALQEQGAHGGFVHDFSGADCDVGAYLLETVLAQVPPSVMHFIRLTALFDRFSLSLCSEALGLANAADSIAWIRAHHLFLIALDHRPRWFRYHHLLSDHLRSSLALNAPAEMHAAYRAASVWFEQRRLDEEAIRYALCGDDVARAADLVERCIADAAWRRGDHDRVMDWYARLPRAALRLRFSLRLSYVRSALWCGRFAQARTALEEIEDDLHGAPPHERAKLPGLALCWYMLHVFTNDVAWLKTNQHNWSADWETSGAPMDIAPMKLTKACSAFLEHDYRHALALATGAQVLYEQADSYAGAAGCRRLRCVIDLEQGRAHDARRQLAVLYQDQCRVLGRYAIIASNTGIRLAEAAYECNDIDAARVALRDAFGISSRYGLQTNFISAFLTMSRVLRLDGEPAAADACLDDGVALGLERNLPRVTLALQAERVRVLLSERRHDDALHAAGMVQVGPHALAAAGAVPAWHARGDGALIGIRLRLASGDTDGLGLLIDDLLIEARRQQRTRWQITLLTLKSLCLQQMGRRSEACDELLRALALAQAGCVTRSIVDEGAQVGALLALLAPTDAVSRTWLGMVRAAASAAPALAPLAGHGAPVSMSPRERAILRLLESGFDNRRLAAHLIISEGTAKWHLRNIFQKLDVRSRTAAIARARSLRLL
ncbi:MAG TPA: LuxR C-terminal-related transcriptional regulator [Telluria sp.]|jgi:LuxR family maltose regulon positive regulatory protein